MRPASNANMAVANAMRFGVDIEVTHYRDVAIAALSKQADPRAASALRRVLDEVEVYQRASAMSALIASKGFSIPEQVDGLEEAVKAHGNTAAQGVSVARSAANAMSNAAVSEYGEEDDEDEDFAAPPPPQPAGPACRP